MDLRRSTGRFQSLGDKLETDFMSDHLLPTPGLANHVDGLRLYHEAHKTERIFQSSSTPTVCQILLPRTILQLQMLSLYRLLQQERIPKRVES